MDDRVNFPDRQLVESRHTGVSAKVLEGTLPALLDGLSNEVDAGMHYESIAFQGWAIYGDALPPVSVASGTVHLELRRAIPQLRRHAHYLGLIRLIIRRITGPCRDTGQETNYSDYHETYKGRSGHFHRQASTRKSV